MKRIGLLLLTLIFCTREAPAQLIVSDPGLQVQQLIMSLQEVAKFVEMIENQVSQIKQLKEQAETLHKYVDTFGNPAAVAPAAVTALTADLKRTELGQSLIALQQSVDATAAMLDSGSGLYHVIGKDFITPLGKKVTRREEPYRPVAAIQNATTNYLHVSQDAAIRRVALKAEIAKTTDALKAAKTDADVQKLTGVLVGLSAALQSTEQELNQAASSAVVQDVANRADERRQIEAKKEQQHAEFTEAMDRYGKTFRLLDAPITFPTH